MSTPGIFNRAIFNNAVFNVGVQSTPGRSGLGGDDVPGLFDKRRKSPDKGWDKEAYDKRRADEDAMAQTLEAAYARITGEDAPISVLAQADAIVRPVAKQEADAPLVIDWQRMARDQERAVALMRLYQEERALQASIDDEDDLLMMLH